MNEVVVCIREWRDQETSCDTLYSIPPHMTGLVRSLQEEGGAEAAISLVLKNGTLFEPTLTIEKIVY